MHSREFSYTRESNICHSWTEHIIGEAHNGTVQGQALTPDGNHKHKHKSGSRSLHTYNSLWQQTSYWHVQCYVHTVCIVKLYRNVVSHYLGNLYQVLHSQVQDLCRFCVTSCELQQQYVAQLQPSWDWSFCLFSQVSVQPLSSICDRLILLFHCSSSWMITPQPVTAKLIIEHCIVEVIIGSLSQE